MTRIKLCGLSRPQDIAAANELRPDYIGFVFVPKSKRYVSPQQAEALKKRFSPEIQAVGVFVSEALETVAALLNQGVIDLAQLHGGEGPEYIAALRRLTARPLIQAIQVRTAADLTLAEASAADHILLDSGAGTGTVFDWTLLRQVKRSYFLAGGLDPDNVGAAVEGLRPWAVDVSSGIETDGGKDPAKMAAFVAAVRKDDRT